jgi:hypothetical protein
MKVNLFTINHSRERINIITAQRDDLSSPISSLMGYA